MTRSYRPLRSPGPAERGVVSSADSPERSVGLGRILLYGLLLLLLGIFGALSFGLWGVAIGPLLGVAIILAVPYLLRTAAFSARARS